MTHPTREQSGGHLMDEPDIGSGGKTPAEQETDEHIKQIPPVPASGPAPAQPTQAPG
jgi:hypothetical protein